MNEEALKKKAHDYVMNHYSSEGYGTCLGKLEENAYMAGYKVAMQEMSEKQEQPGLPDIEESGIPGKDYIPVEWVDACEKYGKWKIVKQEQPEADLDREIIRYKIPFADDREYLNETTLDAIARHFFELGLNARKED